MRSADMQSEFLHTARMTEPLDKHGRLKAARSRKYRTAKAAAEAIGVPYGTYSGHESGSRNFDNDESERYAKFFRVPVEWLVFGVGSAENIEVLELGYHLASVNGRAKSIAPGTIAFSVALSSREALDLMCRLIEANEPAAIQFLRERGSI